MKSVIKISAFCGFVTAIIWKDSTCEQFLYSSAPHTHTHAHTHRVVEKSNQFARGMKERVVSRGERRKGETPPPTHQP